MASSWFFILLLKCIDFLSWPVLALGYPLFASIEAIESESHSETRNLISYWILLSLIYLFEYAFLSILQWFKYWNYMKLIMVFFLIMPDFRRSGYVYNHLIKSCIYVNPQAVISRLRDWKNIFVQKEDFIMQAEKYISQNGTGALEKLLASKNTEQSFHAETRMTPEKNETNIERLVMEQKDIKDLEMIEKEQVPEVKQADNWASDSLESHESTSSAMVETKKMIAKTEEHDGTYPQISATENVQKEWTCAICQMTMPSEANLNCHLQGRMHKAACEALNTKKKAMPANDAGIGSSSQGSAAQNVQNLWKCGICQSTIHSVTDLNSHLQGRKHKAACEALNMKTKVTEVADTGNGALPQMTRLPESNFQSYLQGKKQKAACEARSTKTKLCSENVWMKKNDNKSIIKEQEKDFVDDAKNKVPKMKKVVEWNSCRFRCDMCNVNCTCEADLASHLQGKKHLAQIQLLTEWS